MRNKLFLLFAMLFLISTSHAATFYVRTDGNDGNPGSSNTTGGAWRTIKYGVSQLNTGDVLLINDGYYFEPDEIKLDGKVGSNTNRIIIKAINRRQVKIESNSLYHAIAIVNSVGVTIEGLEVTFQANTRSVYHGMNLDGSNRITVRDCWVHHAPFSGIQGSNSDNIIVEACLITDNCKGMGITENGSGISIAASSDRENNPGFHHILRNNIIYNNEATSNVASTGAPTDGNGIIFDYNNENGFNFSYPNLVENNLIYKNGGRAIHVFGSKNVTIRNNTCYYNNYILDRHGWYNGEIQVEGSGCSIHNNIAVQDPTLSSRMRAIKIYTLTPPPVENNLFVGNIEGTIGSTNITYATGSQANVGFVNASTDPANADFHLQPSSPAVNAGNNSFAPANDLDNVTRPVGGTVDIGCYEHGGMTLRAADNPPGTVAGLDYKYYEGTWSTLPNFDGLTAAKQGNVTNFDLSPRNRNDNFAFRFTGYVNVPSDGTYTFYTSSDDGSKLYIGTTEVVNNDGLHASQERSGTIGLKAGKHAITVTFFENGGGESLGVSYSSSTLSKTAIPASALFRSGSITGNFGFENDFTGWSAYGTATINTANLRPGSTGAKSGYFSDGGGGYTVTGLTPGATYVARAWVKAVGGSDIWVVVNGFDGTKNPGRQMTSTAWTQSGDIVFTPTGTTAILNTWTGNGSAAYFDDFTIQPCSACRISAEAEGGKRMDALTLKLHPNPASREVTLDLSGFAGETAVQVRMGDMNGRSFVTRQVQLKEGVSQVTIPVGHLPRGLFFVSVQGSKATKTARLIIAK